MLLISEAALPVAFSAAHASSAQGVLYVMGDSWSAGLHADPAHTLAQDAADELEMTAIVNAKSGTGYAHAPAGTSNYAQRAAAIRTRGPVRIVVVQGGSNDDSTSRTVLKAAIASTVYSLRAAFPSARIVLLGPGPDPWPYNIRQTAVDTDLRQESVVLHLTYISPISEHWFTSSNIDTIIDPRTKHPTVRGDALIGHRLADDLRQVLPPTHRRR